MARYHSASITIHITLNMNRRLMSPQKNLTEVTVIIFVHDFTAIYFAAVYHQTGCLREHSAAIL